MPLTAGGGKENERPLRSMKASDPFALVDDVEASLLRAAGLTSSPSQSTAASNFGASASNEVIYTVGMDVMYTNAALGLTEQARIIAVHYDDPSEVYYTIMLQKTGNERQTPGQRLRPVDGQPPGADSAVDVAIGDALHGADAQAQAERTQTLGLGGQDKGLRRKKKKRRKKSKAAKQDSELAVASARSDSGMVRI